MSKSAKTTLFDSLFYIKFVFYIKVGVSELKELFFTLLCLTLRLPFSSSTLESLKYSLCSLESCLPSESEESENWVLTFSDKGATLLSVDAVSFVSTPSPLEG